MSFSKSAVLLIFLSAASLSTVSCAKQESPPEQYMGKMGQAKKEAERAAEEARKSAEKMMNEAEKELNAATKNLEEEQEKK